jgi:prepilin-type processing-associated H-X9-DG protein
VFLATTTFNTSPPTPALAGSMQQTLQNVKALCNRKLQPSWDLKGYNWMDGWCGGGGPYSHIVGPNQIACVYSNDGGLGKPPLEDRSMVGASSNHSGGVNVGFLDGSV